MLGCTQSFLRTHRWFYIQPSANFSSGWSVTSFRKCISSFSWSSSQESQIPKHSTRWFLCWRETRIQNCVSCQIECPQENTSTAIITLKVVAGGGWKGNMARERNEVSVTAVQNLLGQVIPTKISSNDAHTNEQQRDLKPIPLGLILSFLVGASKCISCLFVSVFPTFFNSLLVLSLLLARNWVFWTKKERQKWLEASW